MAIIVTVSARLLLVLLVSLALGCGPGLEEGHPPDARLPDHGRPDLVDRALPDSPRDLPPPDAWHCVEHFATNYDHVAQGRATICGGHACAVGSGDDLGLYNTAVGTYLRETKKGYFELGRCP